MISDNTARGNLGRFGRAADPVTRLRNQTVTTESGCWIWQGWTTAGGYGLVKDATRKTRRAHRYMYELAVGPIPPGLTLDHLCRVPACINPAHLEPVTMRTNTLRGDTLPANNARKIACPQGHPYDESNTWTDSRGKRNCRECNRERCRRRRAAKNDPGARATPAPALTLTNP